MRGHGKLLTFSPSCIHRIRTVSKPLLFDLLGLSAERKQTPQIVEKSRYGMELKEALEAVFAPPQQQAEQHKEDRVQHSFEEHIKEKVC
jgi:hypothetical protein